MLQINKIDVFYDKMQALKNISIKVNAGDVVALLGANGSGKTTLLNAISGFISVKNGEIKYFDRSIVGNKAYEIVKMGISQVSQERDLFSELEVFENLKLGCSFIKNKMQNKTKLEEMYETFQILNKRKTQKAGTLSGGEQQMLAIGRALMANPKLLLLDEPTTGLAPIYVQKIIELLERLKEKNITMLLVEQNAPMAVKLADYFYVLRNGKIVCEGYTKSLPVDINSFFHQYYI
jgi:branched-chain amino acid transport system ATP-binding protein